jgi:hypothetical protein
MRRRWKLSALRELAALEPVSSAVISKNIGEGVFNELLNQSFLLHPDDPGLGAKTLHESLMARFGEKFKEPVRRKQYTRRTAPGPTSK